MKKNTPYMNGNGDKHEIVDFEVFLSLIFIGKRVIIYTTLLTVAITLLLSFSMPKKYESTVKILAEPQKENNPYYIESRSDKERMMFLETQKEILISDKVLSKTLAEINNSAADSIKDKEIAKFRKQVKVVSRSALGKNVFSGTGIGNSNTFFVTVTDTSPESAAKKVNQLTKNYIEVAGEVNVEKSSVAMQILDSALKESKDKTKDAHKALADFEAEAGSLLPELMNMNKLSIPVYPELERIRSEFETAKADIAMKKSLVKSVEDSLAANEDIPIPAELASQNSSIKPLKDKVTELQIKIYELKPFYKDSSREITSVQQQLDKLKVNLRKELKLSVEAANQSLIALEAAQEQRANTLTEYDDKMKKLSRLNSIHAELRREYLGSGEAFDTQFQSLAETKISAAKRTPKLVNIAVIDPGMKSYKHVSPNKGKNTIISIILGFGIGVLIILFGQLIHPIFVHPRQIEKTTGLLVVASLNNLRTEGDK